MTLSAAKDILILRIGWRDDKTITGFVLDAPNQVTNSGRFFQGEHSAITLQNIRDCQPLLSISDSDFNAHLANMRTQAAIQVLGDVFENDYVADNLFTLYPTAFDNLFSLRMVISVSELILTSTRINSIERLSDSFVGKLNYDVFRDAPNKFAIRGANYKHSMGISTRYGFELRAAQRRFGNQRNMLRTITSGQAV